MNLEFSGAELAFGSTAEWGSAKSVQSANTSSVFS
jgi:hypothetical protein